MRDGGALRGSARRPWPAGRASASAARSRERKVGRSPGKYRVARSRPRATSFSRSASRSPPRPPRRRRAVHAARRPEERRRVSQVRRRRVLPQPLQRVASWPMRTARRCRRPTARCPLGQGAAMRTETAAADAARTTRQRIDANRALHCGVFVANNAIYSRSVRLNPSLAEHHEESTARTHRCRNCSHKSHK